MARNTSFRVINAFFVLAFGVAAYAASEALGDEADWTDRMVSISAAVAPWLISLMILWATSQIVDAIRSDGGSGAT